jgi:GNAT superfamily N-acetyltransferase
LPTITYRVATEDDVEALGHLRWAMEAERRECAHDRDEYMRAYVRDVGPALASGLYRAWLAEADGEAVASVILITWIMPPAAGHLHRTRGYVSSVYTRTAFRRQGVARRLMELLITAAREDGIQKLMLGASAMGAPLYLSLGFEHSKDAMAMELR